MRLSITEVLEYYDVPQLFVAKDAVGTSYLCLFYDYDESGRMMCISVSISKERLNDFLTGHLDLRHIFTEPEMFFYNVIIDGDIIDAVLRENAPTESMLPDAGYFIDFSQRENSDMVSSTNEEGHTIIRLAFNYDTVNHTVPTDVLSNTINQFQSIIEKAYKRVTRTKDVSPSHLSVRASIAASFDVELITNESVDLFGGSKVADTLSMISPLFGNDDTAAANCLAVFKNTQPNYQSLLKKLSEREFSFKCKWVNGLEVKKVEDFIISRERVKTLYNLASSLVSLEERSVHFDGYFFMANVRNGRWGLDIFQDNRRKYGLCLDVSKLNGVVLKDQLYHIVCKEKTTQNPNTNKTYRTYILTDIHRKND